MSRPVSHRERGISLVIVLLLVVLMSLVTLASLRGTISNERMAAAGTDRNQALQEAEATLREVEAYVQVPTNRNSWPTSGCNAGRCATPVATSADRWKDSSFNGWADASITRGSTSAGSAQFFVEFMGQGPNWAGCDREEPQSPNCLGNRYRITARSAAVAGRAAVVLQSTITTP